MKLVKTMILGTSLLASLSYAAPEVSALPAETQINTDSIVSALNNIKYWGLMRFRNENFTAKDSDSSQYFNDIDYSLFLNSKVDKNLKWDVHVGSRSTSLGKSRDATLNKNVTMAVDLLQFKFTYTYDAIKVQAGQMTLQTPLTDNSPVNPETAVGAIGSYTSDHVEVSAGYFQDLYWAKYYNQYIGTDRFPSALAESQVYSLGLVVNYDALKVQTWGIKVEGVYDALLYAEVGVKYPNYALKLQGISSTLNNEYGGETGLYYAGEGKAKYKNIDARLGFSINDEEQGFYSLDGCDSSGLITQGDQLSLTIDNLADAKSVFGDVKVTMGKFNVRVGYAASTVGDDDITETYGHIGYNYKPNIRTRIAFSDISSENDDYANELVRYELIYRF
jgi:hypothetical protein